MLTRALALLAFACGLLGLAATATAQTPAIVGGSGDWIAYRYEESGTSTCYLASQPKEAKGDYTERAEIWALVTHRAPGDGAAVVSIIAGYNYKEGSAVRVKIGDATFELFTRGDTAWTNTVEDDARLVEAMKKGRTMVVDGVSWRGTETTDTYSLAGFTKSYGEVRKACGL
ncbi:MAG: invasion associated locus B family protein [Alphaproteobacteria bacterium]